MDRTLAIKVAALQLVAVAVLSVALALTLPHSFFENWGWIAGPGAWMLCAALTARVLKLPIPHTLLGAALAGLPSILAVVIGLHWLGAVVAVALFSVWCARAPGREVAWT